MITHCLYFWLRKSEKYGTCQTELGLGGCSCTLARVWEASPALDSAHCTPPAQCAPTPIHCVNTTPAPTAAVCSSSCTAVRSKAFCTPVRISLAAPHNSATPSDHCSPSCSATFFVILQRICFTTMCFYVSAFCDALELQGKHCTAPFGCNASWHWIHYNCIHYIK